MFLRRATSYVRNRTGNGDPEASKVITCLAELVAIAIEFLVEKPTPVGPDPMQKVLNRLDAIKNKLSACTEVATGP